MIDREIVKARPSGAPPAPTGEDPGSAARIAAELDDIIVRSRRRSPLRRALRQVGRALTHWLDNLVPPAPVRDDTEPPPQIRFPFY